MKKIFLYLKENWLAVVFILIMINWVIILINQPWIPVIAIATLLLVFVGGFLSKKIFKLHRGGPIPWYGSPIIWLGLLLSTVLAYVFIVYT